jgi:hypothetical protein
MAQIFTRGTPLELPRIATAAGIGLMMLAALTATWGGITLPIGSMADALVVLALAVVGAHIVFGDLRFSLPPWIWVAPLAILICLAVRWYSPPPIDFLILRYQTAPYKPENFQKGGFWIVALLVVPFVITAYAHLDRRVPRLVAGAYLAGVCLSCLVAVTDLAGLTHIQASLGTENYTLRQSGLAQHANMLGFTSLISLPLGAYFIATACRPLHTILAGASLSLLFAGIFLSGSRGSQLLCAPVVVVSALLSSNPKKTLRRLGVTLLGAAVVGAVGLELFASNLVEDVFRFSDNTKSTFESNAIRGILAQQALTDFANYPIAGVGLKYVVDAHSIYLQILSCGGLLLIIAMAAFWLAMIRDGWRVGRRGEQLGPFVMVSIITWMAAGIIENQLTDRLLYYTVGIACALASIYFYSDTDESPASEPREQRQPQEAML